eukprot:UC4_evm3s166
MQNAILPPSPNWYYSDVADVIKIKEPIRSDEVPVDASSTCIDDDKSATSSDSYIFACVAKNSVLFFMPKEYHQRSSSTGKDTATVPSFTGQLYNGREKTKLSGVAFLPRVDSISHRPVCAVCEAAVGGGYQTESMQVSLWDVRSKTKMAFHDVHKHDVVSITWCTTGKANIPCVVTGDSKGGICIWNTLDSPIRTVPYSSDAIQIIRCQQSRNFIAVGFKNGTVLICRTTDAPQPCIEVISTWRAHDCEIQGLSWALDFPSTSSVVHRHVLASSSKDGVIRTWKGDDNESNWSMLQMWSISSKRDNYQQRSWTAVNFIPGTNGKQLISTGSNGDIYHFDLTVTPPRQKRFTGRLHSRIAFSVTFVAAHPEIDFITTSMDRQIIGWSLLDFRSRWNIPTIGGYVYSISINPKEPQRIAIGCGDNAIRVWKPRSNGILNNENIDSLLSNSYSCEILWRGLNSKVVALLHVSYITEEEESIIVYGTNDGCVGFYATSGKNLGMSGRHVGAVRTLLDLSSGEDNGLTILSLGIDGKLILHRFPQASYSKLAFPKPSNILESEWGNDHLSAACIVNSSSILLGFESGSIYSFCLEDMETDEMVFESVIGAQRSAVSTLSFNRETGFLASGCISGDISVYLLEKSKKGTQTRVDFIGHNDKISQLAWCNSDGYVDLLASSSWDKSIRVWNITSGVTIAIYREHIGRVFSVVWDLMNFGEPSLISGGEDQTARLWRIRDHEPNETNTSKELSNLQESDQKSLNIEERAPKNSKAGTRRNKRKDGSRGKRKSKPGYQPTITNTSGSPYETLDIVKDAINETSSSNSTRLIRLEMWRANLYGALRTAIEQKTLTADMVALSPSIGYDMWVKVSRLYALQCKEKGDTHQAVQHMLCSGDVQEAIETYVDAEMFPDAVVLAKLRLLPDDKRLPAIYQKWSGFEYRRGNFEMAKKILKDGPNGTITTQIMSTLSDLMQDKTPDA